jgi:hypothetical protein
MPKFSLNSMVFAKDPVESLPEHNKSGCNIKDVPLSSVI